MIECTLTGQQFDEWIWLDEERVQCPLCGEIQVHETGETLTPGKTTLTSKKTQQTIEKLNQRIRHINEVNNFDMAWRWAGGGSSEYGPEPTIEVYEEADGHLLTASDPFYIHERLTEALPMWGLTE